MRSKNSSRDGQQIETNTSGEKVTHVEPGFSSLLEKSGASWVVLHKSRGRWIPHSWGNRPRVRHSLEDLPAEKTKKKKRNIEFYERIVESFFKNAIVEPLLDRFFPKK